MDEFEKKLIESFESCVRIAGSAEITFEIESEDVRDSMKVLARLIKKQTAPNVVLKHKLARVLHSMIAIAKVQYAEDGISKYWPFLEARLNQLPPEPGSRHFEIRLEGPNQQYLGELFSQALKEFNFPAPVCGQRHIGPIIYHAGIPDSSVHGLMKVVHAAWNESGNDALKLAEEACCWKIQEFQPPVHISVRSLFRDSPAEATSLLKKLIKIVMAWKSSEDVESQLSELPSLVDPEQVYHYLVELENEPAEHKRSSDTSNVEVRYHARSGEIHIYLNAEYWQEPALKTNQEDLKLKFTKIAGRFVARCLRPLPNHFAVECNISGNREEIQVMSDDTRGIWFDARRGKLVSSDVIDRHGLTPGIWYLLFNGEPTQWNIKNVTKRPLTWSLFETGRNWTAWELEIPEWSEQKTDVQFHYSDIQTPVRIRLSKPQKSRLEFVRRAASIAIHDTAGRYEVYSEMPVVQNKGDGDISLRLWKRSADIWDFQNEITIPSGDELSEIKVEPGCYRITKNRGIGREVFRFAYIPGLRIDEPQYDPDFDNVRIECRADTQSGYWVRNNESEISMISENTIEVHSHTIEPNVTWCWKWNDQTQPDLTFDKMVQGLRWRIIGLDKEGDDVSAFGKWTRNPVLLSRAEGRRQDVNLELHYPKSNRLTVSFDDRQRLTKELPDYNLWKERVSPFVDKEGLEILLDGKDPATVLIISDRPRLEPFDIEISDQELLVGFIIDETSFSPSSDSICLVYQNLTDLNCEPTVLKLDSNQIREGCIPLLVETFAGHDATLFAIAKRISQGFSPKLLLGSEIQNPLEPIATRLDWRTGSFETTQIQSQRSWPDLLLQVAVDQIENRSGSRSVQAYKEMLDGLEPDQNFDWNSAFCFLLDFNSGIHTASNKRNSCRHFAEALHDYLTQHLRKTPALLLNCSKHRLHEAIIYWLNHDFSLGGACPHQWLASDAVGDDQATVYPFQWLCDFWTISQRNLPDGLEFQLTAADRIWQSAVEWGLEFVFKLFPVAGGQAITPGYLTKTCQSGHEHKIEFERKFIKSAESLKDAIGLKDLALDRDKTVLDYLKMPQPYWESDKKSWVLEFPEQGTSRSYTQTELNCPVPGVQQIENLNIASEINQWSMLESTEHLETPDVTNSDGFAKILRPDVIVGKVQDKLLPSLEPTKLTILGQEASVSLKNDTSVKAQIAWRLAWIERMNAHEGGLFNQISNESQGITTDSMSRFNRQLAEALTKWPELMKRCLALAEFLIRIYRLKTVGQAFRFDETIPPDTFDRISSPQAIQPLPVIDHQPKRIVPNLEGVIVYCNTRTKQGKILIKHIHQKSLQEALRCYRNPSEKCWMADFDFNVIPKSEWQRIKQNQDVEDPETWRYLIVSCRLAEISTPDVRHHWQAEEVKFDPNFRRCYIS